MVNDFWLKNKHTISIFQAQVRDLAKHIEAQPKNHNAYKKKRVVLTKWTCQSKNLVKFDVSSRKFKIFHFDGFPLSKPYNVSPKKVQKGYLSWHLRVTQNLKQKLTCGFKYDMLNFVNFHPTSQKFGNVTSMGSFVHCTWGLS